MPFPESLDPHNFIWHLIEKVAAQSVNENPKYSKNSTFTILFFSVNVNSGIFSHFE